MKMRAKTNQEPTLHKNGTLILSFEADEANELKGVLPQTESVIFKNREKSALENLDLVGDTRFRTSLFSVN
jgi:hypothetical protein